MMLNARMMQHVLLALTFGKVWVFPLSVDVPASIMPVYVANQPLTRSQNKLFMLANELGP